MPGRVALSALLAGQSFYCFMHPIAALDVLIYVSLLDGGSQDAFRTAAPTCERYLRGHMMDTRLPMWFVCWEALGTKIAFSNIKKIP